MAFRTVLVLHPDLGFVFWLGQVLVDGGYQALPACSVPAAITLLRQLEPHIDMLIVYPALPSSAEFIEQLERSQTNLKVVAAVEDVEASENTKRQWLLLVRNTIGARFGQHASAMI